MSNSMSSTEDLQDIETRLRAEFPPERFYDLLIRQAARSEMAHRAAEHAVDETARVGARVDTIESLCPHYAPVTCNAE